MKVAIAENVLKQNDEIANLNRQVLRECGIYTINLIGAAGCGKTTLLETTLKKLAPELTCGVIVGGLDSQRDADRIRHCCDHVVHVNTGKRCHLEAHQARHALTELDLYQINLLFIENFGDMICPVGYDLGQDVKIGMFSVTGADDEAAKHPYLVCESGLILLSKFDLLSHVWFDTKLFRADVHRLNPRARLFELSAMTGQGMEQWADWVKEQVKLKSPAVQTENVA